MHKAGTSEANGIVFSEDISAALRAEALTHGELTCSMCGLGQGEIDSATGLKAALNVDYLIGKNQGGKDRPSNLSAVCSICMEGSKSIVTEKPTRIWLLSQIRRACPEDQLAVLEWLRRKFNI